MRCRGSSTQWVQLLALIETLQTGDRLMVSELACLGRSLAQMVQIVERLLQRGVRLVAMKEAIRFEGEQTLQTTAMIALLDSLPRLRPISSLNGPQKG